MLLELMGMAIGASVVEGSRLVKSAKMDDRALKKYAQAFEKNEEARQLVKTKTEFTDKRLMNVARKKRGVMEDAIPKFVEVYSQIQKIDLRGAEDSVNLPLSISEERQAGLQALTLSAKKAFTDKELVCGLMMKGLGGMAIKDSERNLSAARNQLSQAEVIYSQAESVCAACDAVIARADRIAKLLTGLYVLFLKSIETTKETIERNGYNVRNYSETDKGVLMTCVNFAAALSDVMNVPVITQEGAVAETALETIETGEAYLANMQRVLNDA